MNPIIDGIGHLTSTSFLWYRLHEERKGLWFVNQVITSISSSIHNYNNRTLEMQQIELGII